MIKEKEMKHKCPKCGSGMKIYRGVACDKLDCDYKPNFFRWLFITSPWYIKLLIAFVTFATYKCVGLIHLLFNTGGM